MLSRDVDEAFSRIELPARGVRSLIWDGDGLVDLVAGGARHGLDGSFVRAGVFYAFPFDTAVSAVDGSRSVLYRRRGTKGLVLDGRRVTREIDRSYYWADSTEYPVALIRYQGRDLLVHCPHEYCRLEIEDLATGERHTDRETRRPHVFWSRLVGSPDGRWLLSNGWIWHPVEELSLFEIPAVLADPALLDAPSQHESLAEAFFADGWPELSAACFLEDSRVVAYVAAHDDKRMTHRLISYDPQEMRVENVVEVGRCLGTLMGWGREHVIAFYEHPRLIELATGRVVWEWPDLPTGEQASSIVDDIDDAPPPLARDTVGRRFAVALEDRIVAVAGETPGS